MLGCKEGQNVRKLTVAQFKDVYLDRSEGNNVIQADDYFLMESDGFDASYLIFFNSSV